MKTSVLAIIACLALFSSVAYAARIKIHLVKESVERYQLHVNKREAINTACSDATAVDRDSLNLPGQLNKLAQRVTFYRSTVARGNLDTFLNMTQVPLANFSMTYLREVLEILRQKTCFPFFFGGVVRDQFLGTTPNDADVEIDCSIETFYSVCVSTWGEVNCGHSSSRPLGHIGLQVSNLENVDVASTNLTFYAPISQLEYTVNSMAYDLNGNDVIIDLTGTGQMDVCNSPRLIRIPSDDGSIMSWNQWHNDTKGSALLRFWKLRSKGFVAYNTATLQFITTQSMSLLDIDPNAFGRFYCYNVYANSNFITASRSCNTSNEVCESNAGKAVGYNAVLAEDFGSYWTSVIQPSLLPTCGNGALGMGYHASIMCVLLLLAFLL